jgi:hypothetical protein
VPLHGTFGALGGSQQRVLNYSATFDEVEDFERNIRDISGPGGALDTNHGLLIGDNGSLDVPPGAVAAFAPPNANRPQVTVTLPGSTHKIPALTALRGWVRDSVRAPKAPVPGLPNASAASEVGTGRTLFVQAGCASCHGGPNWTISIADFTAPRASWDRGALLPIGREGRA